MKFPDKVTQFTLTPTLVQKRHTLGPGHHFQVAPPGEKPGNCFSKCKICGEFPNKGAFGDANCMLLLCISFKDSKFLRFIFDCFLLGIMKFHDCKYFAHLQELICSTKSERDLFRAEKSDLMTAWDEQQQGNNQINRARRTRS